MSRDMRLDPDLLRNVSCFKSHIISIREPSNWIKKYLHYDLCVVGLVLSLPWYVPYKPTARGIIASRRICFSVHMASNWPQRSILL